MSFASHIIQIPFKSGYLRYPIVYCHHRLGYSSTEAVRRFLFWYSFISVHSRLHPAIILPISLPQFNKNICLFLIWRWRAFSCFLYLFRCIITHSRFLLNHTFACRRNRRGRRRHLGGQNKETGWKQISGNSHREILLHHPPDGDEAKLNQGDP